MINITSKFIEAGYFVRDTRASLSGRRTQSRPMRRSPLHIPPIAADTPTASATMPVTRGGFQSAKTGTSLAGRLMAISRLNRKQRRFQEESIGLAVVVGAAGIGKAAPAPVIAARARVF